MAVTFDAVGPAGGAGQHWTTANTTWAHVNSAAGNALIVETTFFSTGTSDVTAVSYGGVALARIGQRPSGAGTQGGIDTWGVVGGLPTGSNTVAVTNSRAESHNGGSRSYAGAGGFGTAVTADSNGVSVNSITSPSLASTTGGMISASACKGQNGITWAVTGGTVRWSHDSGTGSASDNGEGGDLASPGGSTTVTVTTGGGSLADWMAIVAVEIQAGAAAGVAANIPQQPGGKTWRHRNRRRQQPFPPAIVPPPAPVTYDMRGGGMAVGAGTGPLPLRYISRLAGTNNGYFADQYNKPRLVWGDAVWGLPGNAGRWNSGNWQADYDTYLANRAGQGLTVIYTKPMGTVQNLGINNDGRTFDGLFPFQGGTLANPSTGLTASFWARIDYMLASAKAKGITVFLNAVGYASDFVAGGSGPLANKSAAEFQSYGAALGARYAAQDNLIWMLADDYFSSDDTKLSSFLTGLRGAGANQPISIENMPESTARWTLDAVQVALAWGTSNGQFDTVYSYDQEYLGVERAYAESSPITVIQLDGYFYQGNNVYNGGANYDRAFRQAAWWSLAAGARGKVHGSESMWQYQTTALAASGTDWFYVNNAANIRTAVEALTGWQLLIPDVGSGFITAGRGTRASAFASGGGGGQYEPAFTSSYVAASLTPSGSLALLYIPNATTITINEAKLGGAGTYTATWIDPVTGATSTATPGTTYNTTAKGNNSKGEPDWVLALQGPGTNVVYSKTGGGMAVGTGIGTRLVTRTRNGGAMAVGDGIGTRLLVASRNGGAMASGMGIGTGQRIAGATTITKSGGGMAVGMGIGSRLVVLTRNGGAMAAGMGIGTGAAVSLTKVGGGMAVGMGIGPRLLTATRVGGGMAVGTGICSRLKALTRNGGGMAVGTGVSTRLLALSRSAGGMAVGTGVGTRLATRTRNGGAMAAGTGIAVKGITLSPRAGGAMAAAMGIGLRQLTLLRQAGAMAVGTGIGKGAVVSLSKTGGGMAAGTGIGTGTVRGLVKAGGGMAVGDGIGVTGRVYARTGGGMACGTGIGAKNRAYARSGGAMACGTGIATGTVTHPAVISKAGGAMACGTGIGVKRSTRGFTGGAMACGTGTGAKAASVSKSGAAMACGMGLGTRPPDAPYPGYYVVRSPRGRYAIGGQLHGRYASGSPHGTWSGGPPHG